VHNGQQRLNLMCKKEGAKGIGRSAAAINWNNLPYDIRACDLLMFLNVNLRLIFSTLPMLPSHMSSPAPTTNILVTYGALQVLYCIVLYWWQKVAEQVRHWSCEMVPCCIPRGAPCHTCRWYCHCTSDRTVFSQQKVLHVDCVLGLCTLT